MAPQPLSSTSMLSTIHAPTIESMRDIRIMMYSILKSRSVESSSSRGMRQRRQLRINGGTHPRMVRKKMSWERRRPNFDTLKQSRKGTTRNLKRKGTKTTQVKAWGKQLSFRSSRCFGIETITNPKLSPSKVQSRVRGTKYFIIIMKSDGSTAQLSALSEQLNKNLKERKSAAAISPSRVSLLEQRLGIRAVTQGERFESTLKDFKNLDTFFTINQLLEELNVSEANQTDVERVKYLIELEKLKRWQSDYPKYVQFDRQGKIYVKNDLLRRARLYKNELDDEASGLLESISQDLKEKMRSMDLKENPQLQLYREILDAKPKDAWSKLRKIPRFAEQNKTEPVPLIELPEVDYHQYYKKFQEEADELRQRLRQQQMVFFNQKWGNSVVKMRMRQQQFRRKVSKLSKIEKPPPKQRKEFLPPVVSPIIKEVVDDICYEEGEMRVEKPKYQQRLKELETYSESMHKRYEQPNMMSLRLTINRRIFS